MTPSSASIGPESSMRQVLEIYPGARRALFRRYHIGGCSSCGFQPEETLAQLCKRNNNLSVEEVIRQIAASHEQDLEMQIDPFALADLLRRDKEAKLLDIRTREEWEAARIEGSVLFTQEVLQEMLAKWPRSHFLVIYDHTGTRSPDAAAYFSGHGFEKARYLKGGIDAWSQFIDPHIPRYRLEQEPHS